MQRNNDSKKRKSGFNPNRTCYLTADGKYYCYERWDADAKCVVTQRLEVGKDLSLELTIMLDESDHDMDLQERYESELRDPLFDAKVNSYKADPDKEAQSERLSDFIKVLKAQDGTISEFDGSLWGGMVEFITVGRDKAITVTFRDGSEIQA